MKKNEEKKTEFDSFDSLIIQASFLINQNIKTMKTIKEFDSFDSLIIFFHTQTDRKQKKLFKYSYKTGNRIIGM